MHRTRLLAALVLTPAFAASTPGPALAAPPQVLTAPGRLAVAVPPTRVTDIDAGGATAAVPTGDGGVVALVPSSYGRGFSLVALRPDGRPDPAFGTDGVVRPVVPDAERFDPGQLLRDPQGRLLVVGSRGDAGLQGASQLTVLRLTAQGTVDPGYGTRGIATVPGQPGSGDVAPDGSVVVAVAGSSRDARQSSWEVVRLDPAGRLDAGFGTGGRVRVDAPGARGTDARLLPDGRVVTTAGSSAVATGGLATRLLPDGRVDPTYHGGTPAPIPFPQAIAVRPDGRLDVLQAISAPQVVVRLTPAGERDPTFGSSGSAPVDSSLDFGRLLPRPDGSDLVWAGNPQPGFVADRDLALQEVTATGVTRPLRELSIPFFAGPTSFGSFAASTPHGLQAGALIPRADGRLLVLGGAPVRTYTGEGAGFSTVPVAEALVRPDDTLDPAFGGPVARATVRVALEPRRARTVARTGLLRVRVRASGPGTALVRIRDGRRRIVVEQLLAVAGATETRVTLRLGPKGRKLVTGRRMRVAVGAQLVDVVGAGANAATFATLP